MAALGVMARLARFVHPGIPYHVTHRGNRRQAIFTSDSDRLIYRNLLGEYAAKAGLAIWGYCLMPNHVHLLLVPSAATSLAKGIGLAHRRFAQMQNARHGWTGHLFGGRFYSCALDHAHTWACIRYIERNPVRARLVERAEDWPWSSAAAHGGAYQDTLLDAGRPFPGTLRGGWLEWLTLPPSEQELLAIRGATRTGRPCGSSDWVHQLEQTTSRTLAAKAPGRPRKQGEETEDRNLF